MTPPDYRTAAAAGRPLARAETAYAAARDSLESAAATFTADSAAAESARRFGGSGRAVAATDSAYAAARESLESAAANLTAAAAVRESARAAYRTADSAERNITAARAAGYPADPVAARVAARGEKFLARDRATAARRAARVINSGAPPK